MAASSVVTVGSTYRWKLTATIDGSAWDITSATVTLRFHRPDGSTSEHACVITSGSGGLARYDNAADDLDLEGSWRRSWKIVDGDVIQHSIPIPFRVVETP